MKPQPFFKYHTREKSWDLFTSISGNSKKGGKINIKAVAG
jgi:hypothetical protein